MLSSEKLLANGTKYFHCVGKKIHLRYSSYHVLTRTCSMTEDLSLRSSEPLRVSITQINPSFSHLSTIQSSILQDPSKFHTATKNSRPSSDASLQQQQYYLSFSSLAAKTSRSTKPQPPSLRRLVSPFLLLCHPDKFALIPTSQKVNLKAVQTLNEWIDLCETYMQYTKPSNGDKTSAALPKNPSSQEFVVEFIVPSEADAKYDNSSSVGGAVKVVKRKKGEKGVLHSRRQVTLIFPFDEKYDHSLLSIEKNNKAKMHDIIQARARREILKLIRSAGLKPPTSYESEIEREDEEIIQRGMVDDDGAVKDSYYSSSTSEGIRFVNKLAKDLHGDGDTNNNIVGGRKGIPLFGRRRARAYWEKSQKKFAESINWKALREMEKREDEKFMENFMSIKMGGHEERKRKIIADLVARIRFVDHSNKINLYDNDCNMNDDGSIEQREDDGDTIFSEITQLDQLIAIRRISLLLQDNFDKFQFERSGRVWERLVIIFTNNPEHTFEERKKRRRRLVGGESGFTFGLHTNPSSSISSSATEEEKKYNKRESIFFGHNEKEKKKQKREYDDDFLENGIITVTAPIDFLDHEIIEEFGTTLKDFYIQDDDELFDYKFF